VKELFFTIFILMVVSCSGDNPPESVMSEEEMVSYLIELHIAEASVQNIRLQADSAKVVFSAEEKYLLKKHHINDSIFIHSYNYYIEHPEKLEEIYSAVVDSISLKESLLKDRK